MCIVANELLLVRKNYQLSVQHNQQKVLNFSSNFQKQVNNVGIVYKKLLLWQDNKNYVIRNK